MVAFLRHCEPQQKFADREIERIGKRRELIGKRRELIARVQEELEHYVVQEIHHRKYRSHGGTHRVANLEPVCRDCHK